MSIDHSTTAASPLGATAVHQANQSQPMQWRELIALSVWTLLADLLIFRTIGFSGPALFFALAPLFFLAREFAGQKPWIAMIIVALLWLIAARLSWAGSGLTVAAGVALIFALAMVMCGCLPMELDGIAYAARVLIDGLIWIFGRRLPPTIGNAAASDTTDHSNFDPQRQAIRTPQAANWLLPFAAVLVFGGIFVLANPNLLDWVSRKFTRFADRMWFWIEGMSIWEIPFCLLAFVLGAGLLRPLLPMPRIGPADTRLSFDPAEMRPARLFAAYRNTLITLIVLFAVYLVFEFQTLWRRDFPPGFYYAGYAHQGAAWLTLALALATGLLSLVFSGSMLRDARLIWVRRLTWIWSLQNFLLAAAVYNRLLIYVGYNGMTRLRTVGFFGITVVVVGFVLVLFKIVGNRGFWWLIRGQLLALALTVIVYSLFPVDYVAHRYNAAQVRRGYLHPSVMIAVKPIDDEGVFPVLGLTSVNDPIIREGVLALLAQRQLEIEAKSAGDWHWTKFQASTDLLYDRLWKHQSRWTGYLDGTADRQAAIKSFQNYAMQWY